MFFIILGNLEPRPLACAAQHDQRAVRDAGSPGNTCGSVPDHALPRAAARCGARHRGGGNLRGRQLAGAQPLTGGRLYTIKTVDPARRRRTCRGTGEPLLRARRCQKLKHTDDCPKGWSLTPLHRCVCAAASIRETLSRPDAIHTQVGRNAHRLLRRPRVFRRAATRGPVVHVQAESHCPLTPKKVFYEASCRTKEPQSAGVEFLS